MKVTISPGRAVGTVTAPPSKSMAHRLLICAGLARGTSRITGLAYNEDILATLDCLRTLGAGCTVCGDTVTVTGADIENATPSGPFCCRESGSTLRFFIPLALLCGKAASFTGTQALLRRPLDVYGQLQSVRLIPGEGRLEVRGILEGGTYCLPGNVSSQFLSGLLFALPLAEHDSTICITTPVESRPYIDLTLQALNTFGVQAFWRDAQTLYIPGGQHYRPRDMAVEGDWSAAAFFHAMNALGADITIEGLSPHSLQGDRVCAAYARQLAAGFAELDLSQCPDLAPVLFAVAAARFGGRFTGTHRLKFKESNRAQAMACELAAFGSRVTVEENAVTVQAAAFHAPTRVLQGHNDHRIVMALAVLLTLTGGTIAGAEAVSKSYPDFFDRLRQLGIRIDTDLFFA